MLESGLKDYLFYEEPNLEGNPLLYSEESQNILPSFSEKNDSQNNSSESHLVERKETNSHIKTPVERKAGRRRKSRDDNTIFKTSLSVFRKVIYFTILRVLSSSFLNEANWLG